LTLVFEIILAKLINKFFYLLLVYSCDKHCTLAVLILQAYDLNFSALMNGHPNFQKT